MVPRKAPVCDWCGYAPPRGPHKLELWLDGHVAVSLLLCLACKDACWGSLHDGAERAREARGRAAGLPAFTLGAPIGG